MGSDSIDLSGFSLFFRFPVATIEYQSSLTLFILHEQGHYSIGKEAATAIDRKILSLGEMSSCKVLEAVANDLGNRTINEYKEQELRYDNSTSHGKTQGAWLD